MVEFVRTSSLDFSSSRGVGAVMARWLLRGYAWRVPLFLVSFVVAVTSAMFPEASAINGGKIVASPNDQVLFTVALLADVGADAGNAPQSTEGRLLCGATLVNRSWVLTAKHCVRDGLVVRLDSINFTSGGTLHRVVESKPFPDGNVAVDAALLKIDPPAAWDGIGLASSSDLGEGQAVSLLGWGMSVPGSETSRALRWAEVRVVASRGCVGVNDAELCLADPSNPKVAACFGDSGGPAVVRRGGSYALAGVVSRAGGTAPTCEGSTVLVSAPYVSDWLRGVTSGG
jgi:secreted trypsin-like serine protease